MRGFWGMVLELLPGAAASAIVIGTIMVWRRRRSAGPSDRMGISIRGIATGTVVVLWILLVGSYSYRVVRFHYDIWRLHSDDVVLMQVGAQQFRDPAAIIAVVNDLKASEWYSVSHGGWGDEIPLVFKMRSGATWWMQVGYHFSQRGAVINRLNSDPITKGRINCGHIFSIALPDTLKRIGTPIPLCDTAHGKPCQSTKVEPSAASPAR